MGDGPGEIHPAPARIEPLAEPLRNQTNYRIGPSDNLGAGSIRLKCRDNLTAIETLKTIEAEQRHATPDEKRRLVRYVGWGGIPQIFDDFNSDWQKHREKLQALLTPDEYDAARASTLNAHYTPQHVIAATYGILDRFGFEQGRILEPACGIGHFIGCMPEEMHSRSIITGIEIDSLTARIAKALYPEMPIEVEVEENFGQSASYRETLD